MLVALQKKDRGGEIVRNQNIEMHNNTEWNTEMKTSLILIDEEEWQNGREFMERIKERWDAKHPEHAQPACKCLETTNHYLKKITRQWTWC